MAQRELNQAPFDPNDLLRDGSSPDRGEGIGVIRIESVDVNRIRGLQTILRMLKDNRGHIEGITDDTTVFDLNKYYSDGRHGFVAKSDSEGLVGVFDLKGPDMPTEVSSSGVRLSLGQLNRMCVRTDLQAKGIGSQLTKDAIRRAHEEYGWSNLIAGIVLDEQVTVIIQTVRLDEDTREVVLRAIFERLKLSDGEGGDARVRLFVVRNGFQYIGFGPNVTVNGKSREVLMISHPDPDLTLPQEVS